MNELICYGYNGSNIFRNEAEDKPMDLWTDDEIEQFLIQQPLEDEEELSFIHNA
jgi:hypothetical protein